MKRKIFLSTVAILLAAILAITGCAKPAPAPEAYPTGPIVLVVPWSPGGGTDTICRKVAELMERDLGQPVLVVNRTGGAGQVGYSYTAMAKNDGYTIGAISNSLLLHKHLLPNYVDYTELTPIAVINEDPGSLTVASDAPWDNLMEFLDAARAEPGKIRVATAAAGGIWDVIAVGIEKAAGVEFTIANYKGGAPAAAALAGRHVEATTVSPPEVLSLVEAGKLKVLAIPSEERHHLFPDVPTFKEAGLDFVMGAWRGIAAPKGIPPEVVETLHAVIKKVLDDPEFKEFMHKCGYGEKYMGPDEFTSWLAELDDAYKLLLK